MTRLRLRSAAAWPVAAGLVTTAVFSVAPAAAGTAGRNDAASPHHALLPASAERSGGHRAALRALHHAGSRERVIVLLRDQPATQGHSAHALAVRADAVREAQAPVVARLSGLQARRVHGYRFIDAVSATITRGQAARLATDPRVRAVVPDGRVTLPALPRYPTTTSAAPGNPEPNREPGICPSGSSPQVEPEALSRIHADTVPSSVSGAGVKIAVFPDGVDPTIADFQRGGGSVIGDYHDFTGEGTQAVTGGGEAFGDVGSIAAQGNTTYDLADVVNPQLPLPGPCPIVVKGAAPGATVDVMKVFGSTDQTFDSVILQGMDWAVSHDHVDVLSESFGSNSVPQPTTDPISLFNAQAVQDGITVVSSSGDAGTSGTIGSPASSSRSGIISVGASTALRAAAQVGLYAAPASQCWSSCTQSQGWQDDNVASLSSSGTTEYGPATVDVLAPGDAGWAPCSSDTRRFTDCADPFRSSTSQAVELFGGTSESAPLTAATAALVIQAYEGAHSGAKPSPTLVKQIITSTAKPLSGVPADEQGAGLLDSAAAVALAQHAARATSRSLLVGADQIGRVGQPGNSSSVGVPVTNEGSTPTTVTPTLVTLSAPSQLAGGSFTYDPSSGDTSYPRPTTGAPVVADLKPVTVPAGLARLVVRAAWSQSGERAGEAVEISLINPDGQIVNGSDPQGLAGFAEIEAASPMPGTWHVAVEAVETGYAGPVAWQADGQTASSQPAGAPVNLAPGGAGSVTVPFRFAATAGDLARAVELTDSATGQASQVALLTRTVIPVTRSRAGRFSGTFTGGNGRQYFYAQEIPYQFSVPRGAPAIDVNVRLAHPGYDVIAYLVDPHGVAVDSQSTVAGASPRALSSTRTAHLSWLAPSSGTWHLNLALLGGIRSQRTSGGFAGTVDFQPSRVSARGLPHSSRTRLRRAKVVRARITVTNHGNSTEHYFLDPRLTKSAVRPLKPLDIVRGTLPITYRDLFPIFILPPFGSALSVVADATRPVAVETFPIDPSIGSQGYPDAVSRGFSRRPSVTVSAGDLASGGYACVPQVEGPTDAGLSGGGHYTCDAAGRFPAFATTMSPATGDLWVDQHRWHPVSVAPGKKRTITVRIKPTGRRGQVVRGYVAVESFSLMAFGTDVVAKLPFAYRNG